VFSLELKQNVEQVGLLETKKSNMYKTIDVFFNRILGIKLELQNKLLKEFKQIYKEEMAAALKTGQIVPETKGK